MENSDVCKLCSCSLDDGTPAIRVTRSLGFCSSPSICLDFDIWSHDMALISVVSDLPGKGNAIVCSFSPAYCPLCGRPLKGAYDGKY